jgi:hypothetical protein
LTGKIHRNGDWSFAVIFSNETIQYDATAKRTGNVLNGSFFESGMGTGGFFPSFQLIAPP